ncbi:unnamed protein product [Polarella glacialis]|uniref:Uncharacterized protein n=1 Tax=Polarella glacialis TaxID=89957 RepID=A0A813LR27_POLGL|nr:unnamed protein product [Polarella glacialis]
MDSISEISEASEQDSSFQDTCGFVELQPNPFKLEDLDKQLDVLYNDLCDQLYTGLRGLRTGISVDLTTTVQTMKVADIAFDDQLEADTMLPDSSPVFRKNFRFHLESKNVGQTAWPLEGWKWESEFFRYSRPDLPKILTQSGEFDTCLLEHKRLANYFSDKLQDIDALSSAEWKEHVYNYDYDAWKSSPSEASDADASPPDMPELYSVTVAKPASEETRMKNIVRSQELEFIRKSRQNVSDRNIVRLMQSAKVDAQHPRGYVESAECYAVYQHPRAFSRDACQKRFSIAQKLERLALKSGRVCFDGPSESGLSKLQLDSYVKACGMDLDVGVGSLVLALNAFPDVTTLSSCSSVHAGAHEEEALVAFTADASTAALLQKCIGLDNFRESREDIVRPHRVGGKTEAFRSYILYSAVKGSDGKPDGPQRLRDMMGLATKVFSVLSEVDRSTLAAAGGSEGQAGDAESLPASKRQRSASASVSSTGVVAPQVPPIPLRRYNASETAKWRTSWSASAVRHAVVDSLFEATALAAARDELVSDLKGLLPIETSHTFPAPELPALAKLLAGLRSPEFVRLLEDITGCGQLLHEPRVALVAVPPGGHWLPQYVGGCASSSARTAEGSEDEEDAVAFALFLTEDWWSAADGGSVEIFGPKSAEPMASVLPRANSLLLHEAGLCSSSTRVLTDHAPQLAIHGVYRRQGKAACPPVPRDSIPSGRRQGDLVEGSFSEEDRAELAKLVAPKHLSQSRMDALRERFEEESQLRLPGFLLREVKDRLAQALRSRDRFDGIKGAAGLEEQDVWAPRSGVVMSVKYIDKPEKIDKQEELVRVALQDAQLLLETAAVSFVPIKSQNDEDMKRMQHIIFAMLSSYLQSSSLRLIQAVKARSGFEALRILCKEYEPKTAQRKLTMLFHLLMNPDFGETDEEFLVKWRQWKADIDAYESFVGKPFDTDLMSAVMLNFTPWELRRHRQFNAAYSYLQSKQFWTDLEEEHEAHDRGGHRPMEVDEIEATVQRLMKNQDAQSLEAIEEAKTNKDAGSSKDVGKDAGKEETSSRKGQCGNKGHHARDCRTKPWNYKINELETYQDEPGEDERPSWVLLMCADEDTSLQQLSAHRDELVATVDSGSPVLPGQRWFAAKSPHPLLADRKLKVWSAGGQRIRHYGHKLVDMELEGSIVQMDFDIMDVKRPIVSVMKMMKVGHRVVFETGNCHIRRPDGRAPPMQELGDACVLRGKVVEEGRRHLHMMPVEVEPRPIPQHQGPASREERERHELTHLPHAPWCQVCVKARAREDAHQQTIREETLKQPALTLRLLTAYLLDHGYGAATVVQTKGPELFAISWLLKWLDQLGLEEVMLRLEPEEALRAVAEKIRAMRQKKTLIQEAPVRSSQSVGGVSRYQRSLEAATPGDAIVTWMVRHAAWMLAMFAPWREGAVPYTRLCGAPYRGKVFDSKWLGGVWLGKTGATDEHLVAVDGRVKCFRSLGRLAVEDENRWQPKLIKMLTATPWDMAPAMVSQPSLLTKPTGVVMSARDFPPTPGCPACAKRGQACHGLKHNVRCRQGKQKWMASQLPGPVEVIPQAGQVPQFEETKEPQEEAEVDESRRRMWQKTTPPQAAGSSPAGGLVEKAPIPMDTTATSKRAAAETVQQAQDKKARLVQMLGLEDKLEHNDEMAYGDEGLIEGLPADKVMKGIEKELRGLADKGVMLTTQPEDIPDGARQISMRFVHKMAGEDVKSRIVVRDIKKSQPEEGELFASTPSLASFRLHFALSSLEMNLMLQECGRSEEFVEVLGDIGQAFVHANNDQDIYVWPPEEVRGVEVTIDGEKATLSPDVPWKLRKALYGYRKSPMLWQEHLARVVTERVKLQRSAIDTSTYFDADRKVRLFVHVGDLALGGPVREVNRVLKLMEETLTVKKVVRLEKPGGAGDLLGRRIVRTRKGFLAIGDSMIKEFHMQQAHVVTVPAVSCTDRQLKEATELPEHQGGEVSAVECAASGYRREGGQVIDIAHDRPDLQFAAKEVARAMAHSTSLDLTKLKRIVRYLKQYPMRTFVLELKGLPEALTVFVDSDWAGDRTTRRSTSGGIVMLGDVVLTTWSRTQASVSLSSAKAEYYAITSGAVEAMYVQNLLKEMHCDFPIKICADSSAAKAGAERHGVQRMKHMQIRLMFLKSLVKEGIFQMQKIGTAENPADMPTKALSQEKLQHCLQMLPGLARHEAEIGLLDVEVDTEEESNNV